MDRASALVARTCAAARKRAELRAIHAIGPPRRPVHRPECLTSLPVGDGVAYPEAKANQLAAPQNVALPAARGLSS